MISVLQAEQRAREAGADAFLLKSVSPSRIVATARRLVTGRPARPPGRAGRARGVAEVPAAPALAGVIARTAHAVAALEQPDEALAAILAAARAYLGAAGAVLMRSERRRLVPAAGGQGAAGERPLDEVGLVPAGGGGYPVTLAGWLEGVLLLTDITPGRLAAQEAAIGPLLDLAAAALRNSRVLESLRRQRREREDDSFARFADTPSTAATAQSFGLLPLRTSAPGIFQSLAQRYGELLDLALEQRAYKVDHRLPEALRALADQLGRMRASPRDLIQLHNTGLRERTAKAKSRKAQAYVEEAHIMVLELMGHLASFYRRHAAPAAGPPGAGPSSSGAGARGR